jgi:hypothetical protein
VLAVAFSRELSYHLPYGKDQIRGQSHHPALFRLQTEELLHPQKQEAG